MLVFMTGEARVEGNRLENDATIAAGMALVTIQPRMCADQRIRGAVVVESASRFPTFGSMAIGTVDLHGCAVNIVMTIRAAGFQAQERAGKVLLILFQTFPVGDELRIVTVLASSILMFAHKHETGQGMIERFPALRPVDHFEITSLMVHMAIRTVLETFISVKPLTSFDAFLQ